MVKTSESDIFLKQDLEKLLKNKFVVVIGDSIQRGIYKDIVLLLQENKYLSDGMLRKKGEFSFQNDELIEGGKKGEMNNGTSYREVRQYQSDFNLIRFYFVTRCYNNYMESILSDLSQDPKPDVVMMNSCLWDISRYGVTGVDKYKKNLERLFSRFEEVLPEECLVIWNTTLPISKQARGGFLVPEIKFMNNTLRLDILEANLFASQVAVTHGFDVLDLHYYLRHQLNRRAVDGIHWDMTAHRRITNLLMTHITEAWNEKFPGRNSRLRKSQELDSLQRRTLKEIDYTQTLGKLNQNYDEFHFDSHRLMSYQDNASIKRPNNTARQKLYKERNTENPSSIRTVINNNNGFSEESMNDNSDWSNHDIYQNATNDRNSIATHVEDHKAAYEAALNKHLRQADINRQYNERLQININNNYQRTVLNMNSGTNQNTCVPFPQATTGNMYQQGYDRPYNNQQTYTNDNYYSSPAQNVATGNQSYPQNGCQDYRGQFNQNYQVNNFQWQPYANDYYRNVMRNNVGMRNAPYANYANNIARRQQATAPWQVY